MLYNTSMTNTTGLGFNTFLRTRRAKRLEGDEEVRRHVERLLLRLDFNGQFSKPRLRRRGTEEAAAGVGEILKQGGLV